MVNIRPSHDTNLICIKYLKKGLEEPIDRVLPNYEGIDDAAQYIYENATNFLFAKVHACKMISHGHPSYLWVRYDF